jgi:Zn finger protein HypA/HybF involved in hydrogenase expression
MRGRKLSQEEVIKQLKIVHGEKYDYSLVNYINYDTKIKIKCLKHGVFKQLISNHIKSGCPKCTEELKGEKFIEKSIKKYGKKYDYHLVKYKGIRKKVKIKCNKCGKILEITPDFHLNGGKCVKCYGYKSMRFTQDEYLKRVKKKHGEYRYDYSLTKYVNSRTKIIIKCNNCNTIFQQDPKNHLDGCGCSVCAGNKQLTTEEYIKKARKKHSNIRYDYSLVKYVNSEIKVKVKCNKCGHIFDVEAGSHLCGQGCPKCNESKGELRVGKYLNENNIKYFSQYRFKDCRNKLPLPFDFYLPEYNVCVEFDGEQHYTSDCYFGGKIRNNFERIKLHDNIKNDYCRNNNIKLIRIKYTENVSKKLQKIFNI